MATKKNKPVGIFAAEVSFYKYATDADSKKVVTVEKVLDWIEDGHYENKIKKLRSIKGKDRQKEYKKTNMPGVTFSGKFRQRKKDNLEKHSGLLSLDFDDVAEPEKIKKQIANDPHVAAAFISPRGKGLKVLIPINGAGHQKSFKAVAKYFSEKHDLKVDEACKDVSRLCFFGADKNIYRNENAEIFTVPDTPEEAAKNTVNDSDGIIPKGQRTSKLLSLAGAMRRMGAGELAIGAALVEENKKCDPPLKNKEVLKIAESAARYKPGDVTVGFDPVGFTAQELDEIKMPRLREIVDGLIYEGVNLLVAPPKAGKTYMAFDLALSVATGSEALGYFDARKGVVSALFLEDGRRRLKKRSRDVREKRGNMKPPENLTFFTDWPRWDEGGEEHMVQKIEVDKPALVIVDTLAKVRHQAGRNATLYQDDYHALEGMKKIADTYHVAFLILHHTRKQKAADPLETVSGSFGLTGGADNILVLKRDRSRADAVLHVIGRDQEEKEYALSFEGGIWLHLGDAARYRTTSQRQELVEILEGVKGPMQLSTIAEAVGKSTPATRQLLTGAINEGLVRQRERGSYELV